MKVPLQPIYPTPKAMPFETVALDFIVKLPVSQGYDSILTITDQGCMKVVIQLLSRWPLELRNLYNLDAREWHAVARVVRGHGYALPTQPRQNNNKTGQRPSEHSVRHLWQDAQTAAPSSRTTQEAHDSTRDRDGPPTWTDRGPANRTT
jgi:hypothetical protein